jgi:hypothetical protein
MRKGIEGEQSEELVRGFIEHSASAADLIGTSRSREDGFTPTDDTSTATAVETEPATREHQGDS